MFTENGRPYQKKNPPPATVIKCTDFGQKYKSKPLTCTTVKSLWIHLAVHPGDSVGSLRWPPAKGKKWEACWTPDPSESD